MATSSNRQTFIRFYTDYPNSYFEKSDEIMEGSLSLEQTLIEGGLQFGVPCADKFECDLRNNFIVERKTTIWVYQVIDNDTANPVGLFFGKVDSMKMDALGYVTHLIAYDRFYFRRNKSVHKWWKKYWKNDQNDFTVKGIRDALLTKFNFRFDDVTLLNDNRTVYQPTDFKQITFGELLTQLCAINACIPHIDDTGKICFIQISNRVEHQLSASDFETENCEFEYYDTPIIDGVSVENTETTISSDEDDEEDAENVFAFPYNIFFEGKGERSMLRRANELLDAIKHITYRPCSVKMIQSDYSIKLGEKVRIIVYRNGELVTYDTFVFRNSLSGPLLIEQTFGCDGEADYEVKTSKGLASQVNASSEIVGKTVTVTVNAAENDVVRVIDEDLKVLSTITFASGESSGAATVGINSPGQQLTFYSTIFEKGLTIYVDADVELTITGASGDWELYVQLYTDRNNQATTGVQFVINDADDLEFVDLTSEIGYFTTNMMYRDSATDSEYRPRAGKDCKAFFSRTSGGIQNTRDYVADSIMDAMSFSSQSFLACWARATIYNQNSLLGLPNDCDEIAMVSGYMYNGSVFGMYIMLMLRDRMIGVYAAHLSDRVCTYSNVDWTTDSNNKPVYKLQTVFKFEGSVKVLEIDSTGYEWHEYNPANALLDLEFSKPIVAFTKPKKSEYEIFMWNYNPQMIAVYRGDNKVPITVTDSPATGEYRIYGDYAEYISKTSNATNLITLYEDVDDVIILGQNNGSCYDTHLGVKHKGDVISIDNATYPNQDWRTIIIIKSSTSVLPDEFAIMRYRSNSNLYGYFFNGKTRRVSPSIEQGKYMYRQSNTLYTGSEFAGDIVLQNGLGNSDNSKIAVADRTTLAGWGFYLAEAYYDENAWKERYIGTFTYDSSTPTQSLQGAVREYKIREMYGPESNIFGMVEIKYRNASGESDEYLKYYLNAIFIYTTDLSVIGMRFEEIVNDDIIDMDSDIYHKWRSITSTNGNEYAYIRLLAVTKSVSVDAGVQTIFDYGDWDNTTENTVYTIERNINDMNDFPLMGIDYLESL